MSNCKYIFVTGGVTSSLGKGIVASSLAVLLQGRGFRVTIQKLDPYLNVDPGTLNPYEHGECFVTNDGAETDLDLGHYERFLSVPMSKKNNVTTGSVYEKIIKRERKGDFLGKTVQVIPHVTNEIKNRITALDTKKHDIIITEIGGTVGDIESLPYIETVRQLKFEKGPDAIVIHLTLVPYLSATEELKTKPTQHSVKSLLQLGVQPDILVCRAEINLGKDLKNKIALFCNVNSDAVIESIDASTIYDVPLLLAKQKLDLVVLEKLGYKNHKRLNIRKWNDFLSKLKKPSKKVQIAIVGKYVELKDAYKSISEALIHGGVFNSCEIKIKWIHSEDVNLKSAASIFRNCSGIIVAPGFGERGVNGKLITIQYARTKNISFLGICLGMQMAVVEFSRNVLGLKTAHSTEINSKTKYPVIDLMQNQKVLLNKGGTMRLGSYKCELLKKSKTYNAYKQERIEERHRHRYEFNNDFLDYFKNSAMRFVGTNPESGLIEVLELKNHKWFVGVQFHPEYKSTVINPHPLFKSFVKSTISKK